MNSNEWWECAWCKGWFTIGGIKKSPPPELLAELVSHGICRECKAEVEVQIPKLILAQ